ncbi:hypothetical protein EYF80_040625 [Liparis tanakae]|uniref:Uncharacterized protein n=1 Tax=Liparis tanakae TaxID=230148 RepID=A0A4Z2G9F4_9TELE|nr:hypothetical protein EYF80_040625 [Liparis tanakae]
MPPQQSTEPILRASSLRPVVPVGCTAQSVQLGSLQLPLQGELREPAADVSVLGPESLQLALLLLLPAECESQPLLRGSVALPEQTQSLFRLDPQPVGHGHRDLQLSSEGDPLDGGRNVRLPGLPAASPRLTAASLTFVSEVTLSTLITAHSEGADAVCVQSAGGEATEGLVEPVGEGVGALLEEAAEDKAMAVSSASEGVVGGVW